MDLRPIAIATAVLVLLLPAAPVSAAAPTPAAPSAEAARGADAARILIRNRRFEEALAVLRPLARGKAVEAFILFLYGLAAIEAAQKPGRSEDARGALLDEAIDAFRTMLVARPELVRVRLELARAFFLKREDSLARRHFELVLAGKPPAPVALNVNRFLNLMRARKRWSLRLGAALAPDSNIGAGSDERTIFINGLPFRRDQDELTSSGVGISAWAGRGVPVPAGRPRNGVRGRKLAAAGGRRPVAEGIPGEHVRPDDRLRPCRTALADRPRQRGEPAPEWGPSLDGVGD